MNKKQFDYSAVQKSEAESWLSPDTSIEEKLQRETIRYPMMIKQMGLNYLDTSKMYVMDIGASCTGGISSILPSKKRVCVDPLKDEYAKIVDVSCFLGLKAEELKEKLSEPDLIIVTNALDHFENPHQFLSDVVTYMKGGAYFAHFHAISNHISHPHEAHQWGVTPQMMKEYLWEDFELVWNLDYENDKLVYGWRKQNAFAQLWRKTKYK